MGQSIFFFHAQYFFFRPALTNNRVVYRWCVIQNIRIILPINKSIVCHLVDSRIRISLTLQICLRKQVVFFQRLSLSICSRLKEF